MAALIETQGEREAETKWLCRKTRALHMCTQCGWVGGGCCVSVCICVLVTSCEINCVDQRQTHAAVCLAQLPFFQKLKQLLLSCDR